MFGSFGGFASVLALLSLPAWVIGLFSGKIIAALVGVIVNPMMDAIKRGSAWVDARGATTKRVIVMVLGVAVAFGLRAIGYAVSGCTVDDPVAAACNPLTWDATTWTGVLGALLAMLFKLFQHASTVARATSSGNRVAPGLGSPAAEAAYRDAHTPPPAK